MVQVSQFLTETWTLFAVGAAFTIFRIAVRTKTVGLKHLQPDDYLVCAALLCYAGETTIAHFGGSLYFGHVANPSDSRETENLNRLKVQDAKLHIALWPFYLTALWLLKTSLLFLYLRLTVGLAGGHRSRVFWGFGFVAISWLVVILVVFLTCRPFQRYWQVDPEPPNHCQPAVSEPLVWGCYSFNVATDLYLITLPLPLLRKSSLKTAKKIALSVLFSGGLVVVVCASLRCVLVVTDPEHGGPVSGTWVVREVFVATITTNFPLVFRFILSLFKPVLQGFGCSTFAEYGYDGQKNDGYDSNAVRGASRTIGGGAMVGSGGRLESGRKLRSDPTANLGLTDSEERILSETEMQRLSGITLPLPQEDIETGKISPEGPPRTHVDDDE